MHLNLTIFYIFNKQTKVLFNINKIFLDINSLKTSNNPQFNDITFLNTKNRRINFTNNF